METSNGGLHFETLIDNDKLKKGVEEGLKILNGLGDGAEKEGKRIDSALAVDLTGLKSMAKEAQSIFADLGKSFDLSDAQSKIEALRTVISGNKDVIRDLNADFEQLGKSAKEAFASGDYQAFDELTRKMEETKDSIREVSEETDRFSAVLAGMEASAGQASASLGQVSNAEQQQSNIMVTMLGGQEKYNAILSQMPQGVQNVVKSINMMTGAAKAFIATPLGATIAAIMLALKALKTWFNSSAEGQMAFAKVSGYVSGVLGQLKEIVIAVGKAIYNAFTNPQEAIKKLWNVIKENIVNRIKAVGDMAKAVGKMIKAAFTLDFEGVKEAAKEYMESLIQLGTGVDHLTDKVGEWGKHVKEAAKATADINQQQKQLEIEVSEWQKQNEKLEQVKAEARTKMYTSSLSSAERKQALDAYKKALNEQVQMERNFADRRIELQKRTMDLTSNTIEDENKLRELQAARLAVDTKASQELAMLQRRSNGILNTASSTEKDNTAEELLKLQQKNLQMEIDLMAEGSKKKIAQIRLDYENEIAEIKRQEAKWREVQAGELTQSQSTALSAAAEYAKAQRDEKTMVVEQEAFDAALEGIRTYEQERLKITEEYTKKRKALYVDGEIGGSFVIGAGQENADILNENEKKTLAAIDEQFAARQEAYQDWCDTIANMTLEQLTQVLEQAKNELDEAMASGKGGNDLATARAKVAKAQEQIKKVKKEDTSPDKRSMKEWEDLYKVLNECNKSFKEIGATIGGTAGKFIEAAGEITSSTLSMISGITQLVQTSKTAMSGTATAAATAIKAVESASVILTVIAAAFQIARQVINLISENEEKEHQKEIQSLQNRIDQLQWELDNQAAAKLIEDPGLPLKEIEDAISAYNKARDAVSDEIRNLTTKQMDDEGLWNANVSNHTNAKWAIFDKKYEKNMQDAIKQNEAYRASLEKINEKFVNIKYSATNALGAARYEEAKESLTNYSEQIMLLQEQIEAEQNTSSKDGPDEDAIKEWEQQQAELMAEAIETVNNLYEDLMGTPQDWASELGDAFMEAFANGEDAAEAWGKKVDEIVAGIVKKMLVQRFLEEPLGEIFDKYKSKIFQSDGTLTSMEEFQTAMSEMATDMKGTMDNFSTAVNALPDDLKQMFIGETERSASEKGIATASQDSVDELNGRMTNVQSHTFNIMENTKLLVANTADILDTAVLIEQNTRRLATVESRMKRIDSTLDDFSRNGIKIK